MAAPQDPYYIAKEELRGKVEFIQQRHDKFGRALKTPGATAADPAVKDLYTSLYRDVEAAEKQCKELEKVVALIENNRQRFRHIDNTELAERRAFVTRTKQALVKVWNNLESDYIKQKMVHDERDFQRSKQFNAATDARQQAAHNDNANFIDEQRSRQHMMMKEQDQGLEELGSAVDRVGKMADAMNQELNLQNRMLGELEVEVENTNEQMNFVMGKLSKLLKTKDKGQLMLIVILTVILVVLILITIYV